MTLQDEIILQLQMHSHVLYTLSLTLKEILVAWSVLTSLKPSKTAGEYELPTMSTTNFLISCCTDIFVKLDVDLP